MYDVRWTLALDLRASCRSVCCTELSITLKTKEDIKICSIQVCRVMFVSRSNKGVHGGGGSFQTIILGEDHC